MDPVPAQDPESVAGCDVRGALARQRAQARAIRDLTKVIDCNIEIHRHPHAKREGR
ncbi:hypothetical protein [Streptomyces albospinus]|nr:hypothetical protein [Streptomyces albospinus]